MWKGLHRRTAVWAIAALGSALVVGRIGGTGPRGGRGSDGEAFQPTLKLTVDSVDPRAVGVGERWQDFSFRSLKGETVRISDHAGAPLVVAIRDVGCPVSKRYGPRLAALEARYLPRGVGFLFVNESPHNTLAEMRSEVDSYGYRGAYVHDPGQVLARAVGAKTTTEVFLLDESRTLVYRGAIDDQYGRGVVLPEPKTEFLSDAIEAVLARERVRVQATFAPGCFLGIEDSEAFVPATRETTYCDQVARILQDKCVDCHRRGGAAPFPLETYTQVRGRHGMIRYMVEEGLMPPWFASADCGPWENDMRLTQGDRATLLSWIRNGMPEGDPNDLPVPRNYPEGWTIGEPDLVFEMPEPFELPAEGLIEYMPFVAETVVPEDVWVERFEVLPGAPEVVHHATVTYRPPDGPTAGEFRQDLLGRLVPWSRGYRGWRFLFGYLPGKGPRIYEPGTARFLRAGSRIRFEMHYTPKGVPTQDRTRIGLALAKHEPDWVAQTRMLRNFHVEIPPGEANATFEYHYRMPCTALLRSFTPHMHLRGRTFLAELELPDGSRRKLIEIPEWDPDWQFSYTLKEGVLAPEGSLIHMKGWFDNSAANPNNPDPTAWVSDGQQIWDEMFMMALEWVRPRAEWRASP